MNIPLITKPETNDINASLIAIKREEERLNSLIDTANEKITELNELTLKWKDLVSVAESGNGNPITSNGVASAISDEATARDNAIANAMVQRLRVASATGQQISGASSQDDIDFFTNLVANVGTAALTVFPYTWSSNCTVKCFQGNTLVVAFDTNGQAMILINGRCRPNTWDCLTYLVVGGMNLRGSGVCRLIVGTMSYNGGATLTRNCRTF